jgi:aminopeptidase N
MRRTVIAAAALALACVGVARGDGRQFNPHTGRDLWNYPPDPQVHFDHLILDLEFEDLTSHSFTARETLRFTTLTEPLARLDLDAVALDIHEVSNDDGESLSFRHDGRTLTIRFDPPLPPQTQTAVHIRYTCTEPTEGMYFTGPDESCPDRPPGVHTQGQTEYNRHWFVDHDYPNVRHTVETIVTAPAGNVVIGNGRLVDRAPAGPDHERWHFKLDQPCVPYLVSLIIGDYACVRDEWNGLPVEYYVPPDKTDCARRTFGNTPEMIDLFSKLTGVPYPYAKYAQTACVGYTGGGMENVTATTLLEHCLLTERAAIDQDLDGLISHELAHQWVGDMVTCKSWPHIWLNEGFATFLQKIWTEHHRGRDEYLAEMWNAMRGVADSTSVDYEFGLFYPTYEYAFEPFWRHGAAAYNKGASVLHMLRGSLGDELFWRCVQTYLERFAWQSAETDDFRKIVEELSGRSFEPFFRQWIYRPGCPHITVDYEWDDEANVASLTLTQTQELTPEVPAFAADVDVWLVYGDGWIDKYVVAMSERRTQWTHHCDTEPKQVCIDPRTTLAAKWTFHQPTPMLRAQADRGPTTPARLYAIRALQDKEDPGARETLRRVLRDDRAPWFIRAEAARTLGGMQRPDARTILIDALADASTLAHPKVRRAAVEALGEYRSPTVVPTLLRYAERDESEAVEAAASDALGKQRPTDDILDRLIANCDKDAFRDAIRYGSIRALGALEDARAVPVVMRFAQAGCNPHLQRVAIESLGRLGRPAQLPDDVRDEIREFLIARLVDADRRAVRSVFNALAETRDEKAIPALEKYAAGAVTPDRAAQAREAIDKIRAALKESDAIRDLRDRLDRVEQTLERLEKRPPAPRDSDESGHEE